MPGFIPPGFERRISTPPPDVREGAFTLEKAHTAAQKILVREAIDPAKLGEPFNQRDVLRDMQYAKDKEAELERDATPHEKETMKLAKVLEVAVNAQINAGWFGPNVHTKPTSKFDDVENKIDLIAEIDVHSQGLTAHVALGIDVTYARELKGKISRIQGEIIKNELATVKYYQSQDGHFTGSLNDIPRLVIGVDEERAGIIAKAWYEKNPALKKDPLREQILIELIDQCEAFASYADRMGSAKAAASYRRTQKLLLKAYGSEVTAQKRQEFGKDKVFRQLQILINSL